MKLTADTNVLVRAIVGDDAKQAKLAQRTLDQAELIAIPSSVLCEFVWVLVRGYGISVPDVSGAIRGLLNSANVVLDRPAIDAGLSLLEGGGDFADGVIAFEGSALGAEHFVSFDRDAVRLLKERGVSARLLT